jgi:oxaloacetate decarboxylase gamma subunit
MNNIGSQLIDAATLMATGMMVVFVFLTILVFLVKLMSSLVPQEVPQVATTPIKKNSNALQSKNGVNPKVVAAISAAVHQHRAVNAK